MYLDPNSAANFQYNTYNDPHNTFHPKAQGPVFRIARKYRSAPPYSVPTRMERVANLKNRVRDEGGRSNVDRELFPKLKMFKPDVRNVKKEPIVKREENDSKRDIKPIVKKEETDVKPNPLATAGRRTIKKEEPDTKPSVKPKVTTLKRSIKMEEDSSVSPLHKREKSVKTEEIDKKLNKKKKRGKKEKLAKAEKKKKRKAIKRDQQKVFSQEELPNPEKLPPRMLTKRKWSNSDDDFDVVPRKRRTIRGSGVSAPAGSRIYCRLWKL
ncbi:hypothetical protein GCK72_015238 [Caenorhabditis remanei]|nr:hypothetical protein GCK72_015238 [Caenorhabditis remanei]KAF1758778.1 hypothetical protein GCK72_015238 [Caenorhabditis remanei]